MPDNPDAPRQDPARHAVLALLEQRLPDATICPSEAARVLAPDGWRDLMPQVHGAVDVLIAERLVRLSWKGEPLPARDGPYRIAKA